MGRMDSATTDLRQVLVSSMPTATKAEKAIAGYFLTNLQSLPFETAATVAAKIGISEATVGRYCRSIGFAHFKALKLKLQGDFGDKAWLMGDRLRDFHVRSKAGKSELSRALELEIAAIVANYEIAARAEFSCVVKRLAQAGAVYIAGFQTERGHAAYLAHGLQYLRPGVHLLDSADGHFADVLLSDPAQTALVLFDARRYADVTRKLALAARAAGIKVTLITDPFCDWGHGAADEMFTVQTDFNHFWDATSAMASLASLLINGVFGELGAGVEARMARVSSFYGEFIGHTGTGSGLGRGRMKQ